ncbi:MAG: ribosome-associated translation inhibitor RaiA [Candidatus Poribacteria bacterium]|nr:ribosome-associated translation inhibitor RaiA [Candidatus Poribacteria bacterium]
MRIELIARQFELPEASKTDIAERIERLATHGFPITEATLTLEEHRRQYTADITVYGKRASFHAATHGNADTVSAAVDTVLGRVERQIKRHKSRMIDTRRRAKHTEPMESPRADMPHIPANGVPASVETATPSFELVDAADLFDPKPLRVAQAAALLAGSDDDFYTFRNDETDEVNVVFKQDDGSIGWIHP